MIWFYWDSILICWVKVIVYNALVSLINHRRLPSNCSTKIENKNWIISIKEASLKLLVSQEPVGRKSWAGSSKILGDCLSQFRFVKTFFSPFVLSFLNNFFPIKMLSNRLTIILESTQHSQFTLIHLDRTSLQMRLNAILWFSFELKF